jgi:hypothetical protein
VTSGLISALPSDAVDIVGDVHGELDVLLALVEKLGYDARGEHPAGRRLVFVGDLVDRGPDSVGVVRWVRRCVEEHGGFCVLGNHELNLVRRERKSGNGWFFGEREGAPQTLAGDAEREEILEFLRSLPVGLERTDLRVVHACWHEEAVEELRRVECRETALRLELELPDSLAAEVEAIEVDLHDRSEAPDSHPALVASELLQQNDNPIKVVTSGLEQQTSEPFFAGGRWRVVERVAWWDDYRGPMTVVGHYWRARRVESNVEKLFDGIDPHKPLGRRENVMCVDYSIGRRWRERAAQKPFESDLAALSWPEAELVFGPG